MRADDRIPESIREHAINRLHPQSTVGVNGLHPAETLRYLATPADAPPIGHNLQDQYTLLQPQHPIYQMWQEVWKEALDHYAPEVARFEQKFPPSDDPARPIYPRAVPTLYGSHQQNTNAWIGPNADNSQYVAVTLGFSRLSPDQQRGILRHEAQHGMEAMLHEKQPLEYAQSLERRAKRTFNHARRHDETRADDHSHALGSGEAMISTLLIMKEEAKSMAASHQQWQAISLAVHKHMYESGFSVDAEAFGQAVSNLRQNLLPQAAQAQAAPSPPPNPMVAKSALKEVSRLLKPFNQRLKIASTANIPDPRIEVKSHPLAHLAEKIERLPIFSKATHPDADKRIARLMHEPSSKTVPPVISATMSQAGRNGGVPPAR